MKKIYFLCYLVFVCPGLFAQVKLDTIAYSPSDKTENNKVVSAASDTQIFVYVEVMPEFPGGDSLMRKFIQDNLRYKTIGDIKTGTVYVMFIIEKDGTLSHIHVVKSVPGVPEYDFEAVRVISIMPKWKPGEKDGKPKRVQVVKPVRFVLQ